MLSNYPHSHCWIDPSEAPIERAPYSPVIGPGKREMKPGKRYLCRECGRVLEPKDSILAAVEGEK